MKWETTEENGVPGLGLLLPPPEPGEDSLGEEVRSLLLHSENASAVTLEGWDGEEDFVKVHEISLAAFAEAEHPLCLPICAPPRACFREVFEVIPLTTTTPRPMLVGVVSKIRTVISSELTLTFAEEDDVPVDLATSQLVAPLEAYLEARFGAALNFRVIVPNISPKRRLDSAEVTAML